jgi:hypothetical protein
MRRTIVAEELTIGAEIFRMPQQNQESWPRKTVVDVRTRSTAFREFKSLTGGWPVLSIAFYAGRYVLMAVLMSVLFWPAAQRKRQSRDAVCTDRLPSCHFRVERPGNSGLEP